MIIQVHALQIVHGGQKLETDWMSINQEMVK